VYHRIACPVVFMITKTRHNWLEQFWLDTGHVCLCWAEQTACNVDCAVRTTKPISHWQRTILQSIGLHLRCQPNHLHHHHY